MPAMPSAETRVEARTHCWPWPQPSRQTAVENACRKGRWAGTRIVSCVEGVLVRSAELRVYSACGVDMRKEEGKNTCGGTRGGMNDYFHSGSHYLTGSPSAFSIAL